MIVLVMGVTGSGKTTVGQMLSQQLGWEFADADSFHPPANIEKMRQGIGLTDAERQPWLANIHDAIMRWTAEGRSVVVACSALKRAYRRQLCQGVKLDIVYLRGTYQLIAERLQHRTGHYATESLLTSQFEALEEPVDEEVAVIDINHSTEEIVAEVRKRLGLA